MDSPWDEDAENMGIIRDVEWSKISSDFTNAGYREGIIAGKESASQMGFDVGYATIGVPIGREIGHLRGVASVLLSFLKGPVDIEEIEELVSEARDISSQLSRVRFSDIMPRDIEAEQHAREHLEADGEQLDDNEEITAKRDIENLEDMLANLGGTSTSKRTNQIPTANDIRTLRDRLENLSRRLDLPIFWS